MRRVVALWLLFPLAACSPPGQEEELEVAREIPESVSEEALSAWTIHVEDAVGGESAFQVVVGDDDLSITALSAGIAWRPVDQVLGGDFQLSALFAPRDPATAKDDEYGVVIGGNHLSDPDLSYAFFLVRPNGEHSIGRSQAGLVTPLVDWKTVSDAEGDAEKSAAHGQRLAVRVLGERVEFLIGESVVATLPRGDVQPHGLAGMRIGANASVVVSDWKLAGEQVGLPAERR